LKCASADEKPLRSLYREIKPLDDERRGLSDMEIEFVVRHGDDVFNVFECRPYLFWKLAPDDVAHYGCGYGSAVVEGETFS
jgi:hypothetical protein